MTNCPFCQIPDEDIIWKSDLAFAIYDRFPVSKGHVLIIPRRHIKTYFDATPWEQADIWRAVSELKETLQKELNPAGYNVGFNAGEAAGQTVMHLHVHIIPRYEGDMDDPRGGVRGVIPAKQKYNAEKKLAPITVPAVKTSQSTNVFSELPSFVPGEEVHLVDALRKAFSLASDVAVLAGFVQPSGLDLIVEDIEDVLSREANVRILTGDYLNITSPDALRRLLALSSQYENLDVKVYRTETGSSFHPKAYIFKAGNDGAAFVGSSNLSRTALTSGIEWNVCSTTGVTEHEFDAIQSRFDQLFNSEQAQWLSRELVDAYSQKVPVPPTPEARQETPTPHGIQIEALQSLEELRTRGEQRGLVVLATGLGKTYLSAFDFQQLKGKRALFIAHREEILTQARDSWARIFPDRVMGLLTGDKKEPNADILFGSVQTLAKKRCLTSFEPNHFDYIVVDEFHHAAASTYRKVLGHFSPKFLLGLTATPDRMDGQNLLDLCDGNLAFRVGLIRGITDDYLVPFRYFGVKDSVDFAPIPWRSGKFSAAELAQAVETTSRAEQVFMEYRKHSPDEPRRTLAFCCSTTHADFMARYFRSHGIKAAAVHSKSTSAPRAESLRALRAGELEIICAVDVFNEGLDVPDINTVLMLRPTESPIIFLQQLGRGLRKPDKTTKEYLVVVDFIGNHRSFLSKPQALVALTGREDIPSFRALQLIKDQELELPNGCSIEIELEAIDMLLSISRLSKEDTLIYEYGSLRDAHGRRPTAGEVYAAGVHMKPVKDRYGTWFDFVDAQGDLLDAERVVLEEYRRWFADLFSTQMSKSYKMIVLRTLLDQGKISGSMDALRLTQLCLDYLRRDQVLRVELESSERQGDMPAEFVKRWRKMPLKRWADGKGTSQKWFDLDGDNFSSQLEIDEVHLDTFEMMTHELVDLRLRQHKAKPVVRTNPDLIELATPIRMRISHAHGNPILRFNRKSRADIPEGEVAVRVGEETYTFLFRKIAVNIALENKGGTNLLPTLMRQWFGPTAGLPGSQHYVSLRNAGGRWLLTPENVDAEANKPTVIPFPAIEHFHELEAACGAAMGQTTDPSGKVWLQVQSERTLDTKKHFVVRARGDSMEGGANPIVDGDLVLCEWLDATSPEQIAGKPCLLSGYEGDDLSFAMIKVPVQAGGGWTLRSWNPNFEDIKIDSGTRLRPVASVLEVVEEASGPELWARYNRDAAVSFFGRTNDASWRVGQREIEVQGDPHTVLFVTLRKSNDTPLEHRYSEQFISPREFQWESQASTSPEGKKGLYIVKQEEQERKIHLFLRYQKREDFVYCGLVNYLSHKGSEPMQVRFLLERELPADLFSLWNL